MRLLWFQKEAKFVWKLDSLSIDLSLCLFCNLSSHLDEKSTIKKIQVQIWWLLAPKTPRWPQNPKPAAPSTIYYTVFFFWSSVFLSGFTAHVSNHRIRSKSKSWRFHFSRYKSLIRSWTIVMSSLSVAPKTIWNMYRVAAMWVTEGWTQHQTLEYLCSYDHQKPTFGKSKVCSLICALHVKIPAQEMDFCTVTITHGNR